MRTGATVLLVVAAAFFGASCHASPSTSASCEPGAALAGATYDVSKSRFAFGSTPSVDEEASGTRYVGSHGVLLVQKNGGVLATLDADAPEAVLVTPYFVLTANHAITGATHPSMAGIGINGLEKVTMGFDSLHPVASFLHTYDASSSILVHLPGTVDSLTRH